MTKNVWHHRIERIQDYPEFAKVPLSKKQKRKEANRVRRKKLNEKYPRRK